MRYLQACLVAVATAVVSAADMSGIMEMDLIFPRNDTYAPTHLLPIVFSFRNPELAPILIPRLSITVWDWNNRSNDVLDAIYDLRWENFSSNGNNPHFVYRGFSQFNTEGNWFLKWSFGRSSCVEDFDEFSHPLHNATGGVTSFTTKKSAQEMDLVAATNGKKNCSADMGVAITVTKIQKTNGLDWAGGPDWGGDTCAVVDQSPTTPDPCRVKIDSTAASSILASATARACNGTYHTSRDEGLIPDFCPPTKDERSGGITQQLVAGGSAFLAVSLGFFSCILV